VLEALSISKRFGATQALSGVSFTARPGEIHVLLGENGAGKSTLMNVLAGQIRPDAGTIALDGSMIRTGSQRAAIAAGIGAVHQSSTLFEHMTWEENLALGGFGRGSRILNMREIGRRAAKLAAELGFTLPSPRTLIEGRSLTERVRIEVLRALSFEPRVLILDEPTSVLAPAELGGFLDSIRRLRAQGRIVVLITHKLGEAMAIADRITVLRRGQVVAQTTPGETNDNALASLIVGDVPRSAPAFEARVIGQPVLKVSDLTLEHQGRAVLDRVSFTVNRGEIVGIAGVDGNGQAELIDVFAGLRAPTRGTVLVAGEPVTAAQVGLAVIPQNRDLDGLIITMSLWENMLLPTAIRHEFTRHGLLDRNSVIARCVELIEQFAVRTAGADAAVSSLSGGNRQRFEVGRALHSRPAALVAHNVCRGLDLTAFTEIHRHLSAYARAGGALLLVSSDLDELLTTCDRLAVMHAGRVVFTAPGERSPTRLGLLMAGRSTPVPAPQN
jgi:ABC-type uncharacterized transport system ATPase subunit